jgi:signal transduction histidine kinase
MARVQRGELQPPDVSTFRNDEVGATARALALLVEDLRVAREQREEEVARRHRLERGLEDVDKYVTVGRLSAGLAHEIGSPLQILEGRAADLARKSTDGEVRRVAGILVEQAQRITRIVSQLLAVARRRRPRRLVLDLAAVVQPIVELLRHEARRASVHLELITAADTPRLEGDPDQLQQVALNLLRNALQADARTVAIRLGPGPLAEAGPLTTRRAALLEVCDDGRGMSDHARDRAFEPFFTTREAEGGTGLGLAVVRGIVEEHGGSVSIAPHSPRGTSFVVRLPALEDSP